MIEFSTSLACMISLNLLQRILGRGKSPFVGSFQIPNPSAKGTDLIVIILVHLIVGLFMPPDGCRFPFLRLCNTSAFYLMHIHIHPTLVSIYQLIKDEQNIYSPS